MLIKKKLLFSFFKKKNSNAFYSLIQIVKKGQTVSTKLQKNKFNVFSKKKKFNLSSAKIVFGIGDSSIAKICNKFGLNTRVKILKCKLKTVTKITTLINKLTFKKTLKIKLINIRKFTTDKLRNYRGARHTFRYPVRGQRTHTNAQTRKRLGNNKAQRDLS
jgi:small subunit ribosomal protein S13